MSRDCDRSCTGFSGGDHRRSIGSALTWSARPPRRTAWTLATTGRTGRARVAAGIRGVGRRCGLRRHRADGVHALGGGDVPFTKRTQHAPARPGVAWCLSRPARLGFHALPPAVRAPARELGVRDWLIAAATSGELSTTQTARLERCGGFARALKTGDLRVVAATEWPNVLPEERGKIVSQILEHVAITTEAQQRKLLAACVSAWPDGLRPGAGPERHRDGPRQDALVGFV